MLEDKEVRLSVAGEPDEGLVVILDDALDLFAVRHFDADTGAGLDQLLEVLGFLEGVLRGARRFSLWWWRNSFSYFFFLPARSGVTEMRDGSSDPLPSASP